MSTRTEQTAFDFTLRRSEATTPPPEPKPFAATVTVTEAARILGISRTTAYEAVRHGSLPSIRVRRRIVIPRSWLDEMLSGEHADR